MMKKQIFLFLLVAVTLALVSSETLRSFEASPAPAVDKVVRGTHGLARSGNKQIPLNMVLIPHGDVVLGLNQDTIEKLGQGQKGFMETFAGSLPRHTVRNIREFFCDKFEVTNAQWKAYLDATGQVPSELLRKLAWLDGPDGGASFPEGQANFPIRNVDLYEARAYAAWCGKRLPTEEEWMRAAAGDDGRLYSWGDEWKQELNASKDRRTHREILTPVGSREKAASPFGILDMTGSVWEWTDSQFRPYPKYKPIKIKFGRKSEVLSPGFDARHYILKGGVYNGNDITNILPVRQPVLPNTNYDTIGFRCVKSSKPGKDIFAAAVKELGSSYLKDSKWDDSNFYAIEISKIDAQQKIIQSFESFVFAPTTGVLTSINKVLKNGNPTPDGYLTLGVISVSRPLEEPNLPPGNYTMVYRHKGALPKEKMVEKPVAKKEAPQKPAEKKKNGKKNGKKTGKKKKGDDEVEEKTAEELKQEEEDRRIEEENRQAKEAADAENRRAQEELERIGAVLKSQKQDIEFPDGKNLVLFLNPSDAVVGYVEVEHFTEGGEEPIRVIHIQGSGRTDIEFTIRILGGKHPRFTLPIKIRNNPFLGY